jgi:hypothetical protein
MRKLKLGWRTVRGRCWELFQRRRITKMKRLEMRTSPKRREKRPTYEVVGKVWRWTKTEMRG